MSYYYCLVNHDKKKRLQVGQGDSDRMKGLYTAEPYRTRLHNFLNDSKGDKLQFVCIDYHDSLYEYDNYEDITPSEVHSKPASQTHSPPRSTPPASEP